jgi:hypothetical protein
VTTYTASQLAKNAEISNSTGGEWLAHIFTLGIPRDRLCTDAKRPRYTQLAADLFASLGTARKSGVSFHDWATQAAIDFEDEFPFEAEGDLSITVEVMEEETAALVPVGDRQEFLAKATQARAIADLAMDLLFNDVRGTEASAIDSQASDQLIALSEMAAIKREEGIRAATRQRWEDRKREQAAKDLGDMIQGFGGKKDALP